MKVYNMTSSRTGNAVANQFDISHDGKIYFQSYDSLIACYDYESGILTLGKYWDYSNTIIKYFHQWMEEHFLTVKLFERYGKTFSQTVRNAIKDGKIVYDEEMF